MCRGIRRRTLTARSAGACWWSAWDSRPARCSSRRMAAHSASIRFPASGTCEGAEEVWQMNIMRSCKMYWLTAQIVALMAVAPVQHVRAADPVKVREAGVAGGFYPADPKELAAMIDEMVGKATPAPKR